MIPRRMLAAIMAQGVGNAVSPTLSLDFTSALPGQVTFARTGPRTAIQSGVLTTISSGNPAIESWDGVNRGLSIDAASTNILTFSNVLSDASWAKDNLTSVTVGSPGPDGNATSAFDVVETTANGFHGLRKTGASTGSGTVTCVSAFFMQKSGATRWGQAIRQTVQFNNNGARNYAMSNGTPGCYHVYDTNYTNVQSGVQKLANGWYRAWVTATTATTANREYGVRNLDTTAANIETYTGATSQGFRAYGFQCETGVTRPTSYKDTTTGTVSTSADSATITDLSWFNSAQGTFIIEHDCASGAVLGSGVNTVISGHDISGGKVALAWNGTTSDLVKNGGSTTAGGLPTFSTSFSLLAANGVTTTGHIKQITYYPTRLTVAQMQTLTAPVTTAQSNVWRVAATKNKMSVLAQAMSGTTPRATFRFPVTIGSGDCSSLALDFSNFWSDDTGDHTLGNAMKIEKVSLERVTGVSEYVPVTFSAARSLTLADGATNILSDPILPSSFTGLSKFNQGDQFFIRVMVSVTTSGQSIPVGRYTGVETGSFAVVYDASVITVTDVDGVGTMNYSGGTPTLPIRAYVPILVGKFVSGDPKTVIAVGDSILDGIAQNSGDTYVNIACKNLGLSYLEFAKGGQSQSMPMNSTRIQGYMAYARIMIDENGTNAQGASLYYFSVYAKARAAGVGYIIKPSLLPRSTSTDSFATGANQSSIYAYPTPPESFGIACAQNGMIEQYTYLSSLRDVSIPNVNYWLTNGVANTYTADGTHPTSAAYVIEAAEFQPLLAAVALH